MLGIALVAVSVGLSNFAGSIGIGISGVSARTRLRVGIAFGFFEAITPIIGLLIGQGAAGFLGATGRYVGGGLLIVTGAYTIYQGRATGKEADAKAGMDTRLLLTTAAALSVDNLVVGFALGVYHVNIALAAVIIAAVSVAMSLAGLELGSRLGERVEAYAEEIGGGVLIVIGIVIALGILH